MSGEMGREADGMTTLGPREGEGERPMRGIDKVEGKDKVEGVVEQCEREREKKRERWGGKGERERERKSNPTHADREGVRKSERARERERERGREGEGDREGEKERATQLTRLTGGGYTRVHLREQNSRENSPVYREGLYACTHP